MKGDTLVEVLVALAVATVVISALTSLGIVTINNVRYIKDEDQSTKYAQEGMETVRNIRDSNYLAFRNYDGRYCLGTDPTLTNAVASCTITNLEDHYIRSVQVTRNGCGGNLSSVTVTVAWSDTKCLSGTYCHSSKISSCFSTVPPVNAP